MRQRHLLLILAYHWLQCSLQLGGHQPSRPYTLSITDHSVNVTWLPPCASEGPYLAYKVYAKSNGIWAEGRETISVRQEWETKDTAPSPPLFLIFNDLLPDTRYQFKVAAKNAQGYGRHSRVSDEIHTVVANGPEIDDVFEDEVCDPQKKKIADWKQTILDEQDEDEPSALKIKHFEEKVEKAIPVTTVCGVRQNGWLFNQYTAAHEYLDAENNTVFQLPNAIRPSEEAIKCDIQEKTSGCAYDPFTRHMTIADSSREPSKSDLGLDGLPYKPFTKTESPNKKGWCNKYSISRGTKGSGQQINKGWCCPGRQGWQHQLDDSFFFGIGNVENITDTNLWNSLVMLNTTQEVVAPSKDQRIVAHNKTQTA